MVTRNLQIVPTSGTMLQLNGVVKSESLHPSDAYSKC